MATYSISGTVTLGGSGVALITVSAFDSSGDLVTTDNTAVDGTYTLADLPDSATYTVRPHYPGYSFSPASDDIAISGGNETSVDFAATAIARKPYRIPGTLEITWALQQLPVATAQYVGAVGDVSLAPGDLGQFADGSTTVFAGTVDDVTQELIAQRTDYAIWTISMTGQAGILRRRTVTFPYGDTTVNAALTTIQNDVLAGEGISLGTVDAGTTAITFEDYTKWPVTDILDKLAEAIGGYWYVDPWPKQLHLRQFGAVSAPWALSTSANVRNIKVRRHRDEYFNVVYIDNGSIVIYDTNDTEITARQAEEGGTGRYERVITVSSDWTQTQMETYAAQVLAKHDEMGWEITYTTDDGDTIDVGMDQTVNLNTEFGIPAATDMRVQRKVLREVYTDRHEYDITLESVDYGRGWERDWRQAFMPGAFGTPRYYLP